MVVLSRLLTLVCALALTAHASAPCGGWKAEERARLDCCVNHCPMQEGEAHHGSHEPVSQADADACCAISDRDDAAPAAGLPALGMALALVASPVPLPGHVAARDIWRTAAPVPVRTISTHLLLTVLLV